jgi:hypothetical protein
LKTPHGDHVAHLSWLKRAYVNLNLARRAIVDLIAAMSNFTFAYVNWTAPPIDQLNFSSNCSLVATWARTWLSDEPGPHGVDYYATANYFRNALPPELQNILSSGQLVDWYRALLNDYKAHYSEYNSTHRSPFSLYVTTGPFNACLNEVCKAIRWDGIPDITGPGVGSLDTGSYNSH